MFRIGDLVVHPMHGAGVIDDIVRERVAGSTKEYYVFKMPMGGLVLKIPTENSQAIGIRPVITAEEADALLNAVSSIKPEHNANWNKRYQENLLRLKSGDLYEVAQVVKGLMHRDAVRGLSTGERKMLHSAKQIMLSELALVLECDYKAVEMRLDRRLTKTLRGTFYAAFFEENTGEQKTVLLRFGRRRRQFQPDGRRK